MAFSVVGIGNRYLKQYDESRAYFLRAEELYTKLDDKMGVARVTGNLASTLFEQGDTITAISKYKMLAKLAEEHKDYRSQVIGLYNAANGYYQLAMYDSATVYIDQAIPVAKDMGKRMTYMIDYKKGVIDIELAENERGLARLEGAYEVALELGSYVDARDMAHYLVRGSEAIGDMSAALDYSRKYTELKDSVISIESSATINELRTKYETEKKELQIVNLELTNSRQKQRLVGGAVALGLISLLSFFLFQLYQKVKSQKAVITKALSEKDLLLREIHHRVKNNLQLVSSLLTLQGRSIDDEMAQQAIREGQSRVRSMALIHQDLYNKENLMDIGVREYMEKLTQEIFSTYQIEPDRVTLTMQIDDIELDVDTLVPLGLIINELITNSLKYAYTDRSAGALSVSLTQGDRTLMLRVSDDGVGYDPLQVRKNSFGSTLITALVEQLEGDMQLSIEGGTNVEITIPKNQS